MKRIRFVDPEVCPNPLCKGRGHVLAKRRRAGGLIWRRHGCTRCGRRWSSYHSLADPRDANPDDFDPGALEAR